LRYARHRAVAESSPGHQPPPQYFILAAAWRDYSSAAMRNTSGSLGQKQARLWLDQIQSPPRHISGNLFPVKLSLGPKKRQPKAVLPLHRAVAPAAIAAHARKHCLDVAAEERNCIGTCLLRRCR